MTVAEWVLLRHLLGEEALAPSRLSERMGMTRGTVSKLAERLIAKGLLVRADNPEDARAHTLSLTSKGRRARARTGGAGRRQRFRILRSPCAEGPRGAAPDTPGDRRETRSSHRACRLKRLVRWERRMT